MSEETYYYWAACLKKAVSATLGPNELVRYSSREVEVRFLSEEDAKEHLPVRAGRVHMDTYVMPANLHSLSPLEVLAVQAAEDPTDALPRLKKRRHR